MTCRPAKNLVVTHIVSGDIWAGAEVQVYNLCEALKASNKIQPTAVIFNPGILHTKLLELGIPVTLADEKSLGPIAIARSIAAHCNSNNSRVVHTHGFKENILGIAGKELSRCPYSIRTIHGNPEYSSPVWNLKKWSVSKADIWLGRARQQKIIAVSTQLEKNLEKFFPNKVETIFNFINVRDIRKQYLNTPKIRTGVLKLGIVGRLVTVKRLDIFIKTVARLNNKGFDCDGIIVGDGPLKNELELLAQELNIDHRIEFKGFMCPSLHVMRTFDFLLMTSDHEGLPMTLLEALALEIPVLAHNVGGIPEILSYGESGYLVDEHSPAGYASAVEYALAKPEQTKTMTENGLLTISKFFDKNVQAKKYIDLYHQIS